MCGIAGFYQTAFDYTQNAEWTERLEKMKQSLRRRGPNEEGVGLAPHAGLAHTRLSIIDLAGGHQPMSQKYNDRRCTLVYNGELYNAAELKARLEPYRLPWKTASDTEVILNGYLALGPNFWKEMNGIFALALYDETLDCLYLCRDRLGVKPLFYCQQGQTLIFGSEPKALFAYGVQPCLDKDSWGEIFGLGPARTPGKGVFKGVKELLPGHFIKAQGANILQTPYWSLQAKEHTDSYENTVDFMSFLIKDSIKRQMVSDISICTFLSGGLDSSLVSAVCAEELKKQGRQLNTFSFDFAGNKENFQSNDFQSSQDQPFALLMADFIGSHHTVLECSSETLADCLYLAVDAQDLPCMADVESSMLYFCSQVAQHHHVTLTGECADEIFGGYPWFHQQEALNCNHFPWSRDMQARTALLRDDFIASHDFAAYSQAAYEESVAQTPLLLTDSSLQVQRRKIAWLNIRWFMATLLNRMDRTSMYSGLEARVPFADHRILEYAYNIPWEMKCRNGMRKSLLIEAGKDCLPPEVLYRKKNPYPKTYDPTYERLLGERLLDVLADPTAPLSAIADRKKAEQFLKSPTNYGRPWYGQLMAGPQMLAYLLQIDYWMKKYQL